MPDLNTALAWVGQRIDDVYGGRLGKIEDVYTDDATGEPVWLAVRLGRFGDERVAVPAENATAGEGGVWIPYERQTVRSAGPLAPGEAIAGERDRKLAEHYELSRGPAATRPARASESAPRA